jgi:arginine decarboxylase
MNDLSDVLSVRARPSLDPELRLRLTRGIGRGPTELAAFDAALMDAGVANYNLICLSSVIPPGSTIERGKYHTPQDEYGRRLYVVLSQMRQSTPGAWAHAGVGWVQNPARRHGLFVELHDEDRDRLVANLHTTLHSMQRYRDDSYGPVQTEIASVRCCDEPVCSLVMAVYRSTPW